MRFSSSLLVVSWLFVFVNGACPTQTGGVYDCITAANVCDGCVFDCLDDIDCTVNCNEQLACQNTIINAPLNADLYVNCILKSAFNSDPCNGLTVNPVNPGINDTIGNLYIDCDDATSCETLNITYPGIDFNNPDPIIINLRCHNDLGAPTCESITLDGTYSDSITIIVEDDANFENSNIFTYSSKTDVNILILDGHFTSNNIYLGGSLNFSTFTTDDADPISGTTIWASTDPTELTSSIYVLCDGISSACNSLTIHGENVTSSPGALTINTTSTVTPQSMAIYCPRNGFAYPGSNTDKDNKQCILNNVNEFQLGDVYAQEGFQDFLLNCDRSGSCWTGSTMHCGFENKEYTCDTVGLSFVDEWQCAAGNLNATRCNFKVTDSPTDFPSQPPTRVPSQSPSQPPTAAPSNLPSRVPSNAPSTVPSNVPSNAPSRVPSNAPSYSPSRVPSGAPSRVPSNAPSYSPSAVPSNAPSRVPSNAPSYSPSAVPSGAPSRGPSNAPSSLPSAVPSNAPSNAPSSVPSNAPSFSPSAVPSNAPTTIPTPPSSAPTQEPSIAPTDIDTGTINTENGLIESGMLDIILYVIIGGLTISAGILTWQIKQKYGLFE